MPASEGRVSIDTLRKAASWSVAGASLRRVARDVGMSPTGLQNFLDGSSPYSATRKKLERWYVRSGHDPDHHAALAALEVLVQHLPPAERTQAVRRLVGVVAKGKTGRPPSWVKLLRSELDER